ncbi:MAG TPA: hypothetical protein P5528_15220 [Steroidobacteraceae bacterium]|nr:hypothetical protein [Steroidobacteraceae bacterium]HRX90789.1 hypothetical protein [Steroidobacteraceae bacterium]
MSRRPRGTRPLAMAIGAAISLLGALALLARYDWGRATAPDVDPGAAWAFVQFLAGAWSGVLGVGNPLVHGLVAGVPALAIGLLWGTSLPAQFDILAYFAAPGAAVLAAAVMRYSVRRNLSG